MITVQVIGREALAAKFAASLKTMEATKPVTLRKIGMAQQMNIRDTIWQMLQVRSGNLFNSVRVFYQTKNGISVGTGKGLDYAHALEFGALPHRIVASGIGGSTRHHTEGGSFTYSAPGGAQNLAFWWANADMFFVGPAVNHPGNRPYKFIQVGFMRSVPQVYRYCCDMIAAAFGIPMR